MNGSKIGRRAAIVVALASLAAMAALMIQNGAIQFNHPSEAEYPVRGVDVSHYQGEIDWDVLAGQGIRFAFIKATEGSGSVDERFVYNFDQARKAGLRVGAYHFFSFDSPGLTQAENFIQTVAEAPDALPPVIDVEFYGGKERNPPAPEKVWPELDALVSRLEEYYGHPPILYATERAYRLYIANRYENCDIWIRDVFARPKLSDDRAWTFWQYADRARLDGYDGEEQFIDLNAFNGTIEEFEQYAK
ncbi:MAG: GH25 family lysozyme [Clostridia bacterium]|nr:GH25 family lysozyme [Clostridia bacterium]